MFSAVTETRPSGGEDQHDRAEAGKDVVADVELGDAGAVEVLARPRGEGAPTIIIQAPPSAEPPVGPVERLAHRHVRRQVARVVRDVDRPADLVAGHDAELAEERAGLEVADVERARGIVRVKNSVIVKMPKMTIMRYGQPPLGPVDEVVADQRDDQRQQRSR